MSIPLQGLDGYATFLRLEDMAERLGNCTPDVIAKVVEDFKAAAISLHPEYAASDQSMAYIKMLCRKLGEHLSVGKPTDHLWTFNSTPDFWEGGKGRSGYCVLRGNVVVCVYITAIS